ncbi:MAG: M28 family peptidase, partial [Pseudomonadota bacterium]
MALIEPHGGGKLKPLYVMDEAQRADLAKEALGLPSIVISSAAAGNAVMLGGGYFTPLEGFMNKADALGVAKELKTASGLFWPTPVLNMVEDAGAIKAGDRIALRDPNVAGNPVLAIQDVKAVETFTDDEMAMMTQKVYRTDDMAHPGVKAFNTVGKTCISGPIKVLNYSYFDKDFPVAFVDRGKVEKAVSELKTWADAIDDTLSPSPKPTGVNATLSAKADISSIETENVLAVAPGQDPKLAEQTIVVSGHMDHLGRDLDSGIIFNGADDNASGTAVTMELARAVAHPAFMPARTIVFAAWNAEESGLRGACHYASKPTYDVFKTVAMFSVDMVGAGNGQGVSVFGGNKDGYSWLSDLIKGAAADKTDYKVSLVEAVDASVEVCFAS